MIKRFVFGTPFPTESVVLDLPVETGPVPFLTPDGDGWTYTMQEKDIVYGLGEMPRSLNKRGWHYETNNSASLRPSCAITPTLRAGSRSSTASPTFCLPSGICWACVMPFCPPSTVNP